jgi:uncharacterized Zn-binding protein involved in type VI secretion
MIALPMKKLITFLLLALPLGAWAQSAVRQTDVTSHGGTVTSGSPNVFVNGKPMAKVGSAQSCPLPGHVGGTITSGSASVRVNGVPAAKVGSSATCVGSTTVITGGSPNVSLGN